MLDSAMINLPWTCSWSVVGLAQEQLQWYQKLKSVEKKQTCLVLLCCDLYIKWIQGKYVSPYLVCTGWCKFLRSSSEFYLMFNVKPFNILTQNTRSYLVIALTRPLQVMSSPYTCVVPTQMKPLCPVCVSWLDSIRFLQVVTCSQSSISILK